ncbi:hypothetical protein QQS21_002585 [Conoideocrella luteorostrata]|uniref:Alpha-galactosidase n=1 Tax=Conoideocrella luteorostrata TaxID=1105319 RepID=A0AAJ0CUW9_9HYPO|nr:hypothetical protein QQS21_002585 [Conoideocrella luteorostrata]
MKNQVVMAAAGLASSAAAQQNVLPLPPMGFNNWARFMTNINESIFVDAADSMSKNGLLSAGYNRLNLDDAWSTKERAKNGSMVWDPVKFPKGLPWLTSYMRSKGFIPGIYTDAGNLSCGGYPGALNHEAVDVKDFQNWGFDYLKMDGCNLPDDSEATYHEVYSRWPKAIAASGKPMAFSDSAPAYFSGAKNLTDWYAVMVWAAEYGQLARHSADVVTYPKGNGWSSIMYNYGQNVRLARFQKPGFFNDPDFLIPDHPSLSMDEKKSQFALWSSLSAPLLLSAHIPSLSKDIINFLTNKDIIAVNQDKLIEQATLVSQDGSWDVLTKNLANGDRLLTVLNRGAAPANIKVSWERIGLSPKALGKSTIQVKDLWTGKISKVAATDGGISVSQVPSHGTAVFRISKTPSPVTPTGMIFNTLSLKCLTDDKSGKVTWAKCNAADAQVWAVRADGHINSLLRPDECIVDAKGKILSRHSGCHSDAWTYKISGDLVNGVSGMCLTEATDGTATAESCGYLLNEQVVALPVGVKVV